jgi:thimet oligopeptidase
MKKLPLTEKDFEWYKLTPKQIEKIGKEAIAFKKEEYRKIKEILPEERTYLNTIYALEHGDGEMGAMMRKAAVLGEVSPKEAVRAKVSEVLIDVSNQMVDIEYDRDVYIAILEYYEGNYRDEKKSLGKDDIKLLEDVIKECKHLGFDLPEKQRAKFRALLKKSSALCEHFGKNINDYNDYILCTREELNGLADRVIDSLPKDTSGKYMVTLQYPHIGPFMQFATNRAKREELANKNLQKGGKKNLKIINDLIKIREEIASILGYATYADFKMEDRMAKKGEIAEKFQNDLLKKLIKPAAKDIQDLATHAKSMGIKKLEHFDVSFMSNDLQKKLYGIDPELVREYFPLEHVLGEMFKLFGKLFGLSFKELPWKTWHKDVRLYEVRNTKGKELVGYLIFDLFPRPGKYGHAMCVDTVIPHETSWHSGKCIAPVTTVVCNFPYATKKLPSLLSIGEVETLFHEFGHALHMTLSSVRHESQSGANVAWDFVETPSQIMENWVWNDTMLKQLSRHYATSKSLPKDMREKILSSKKFLNAYSYMRQLIMGKIDLDLHMGKIKDATQAYRQMTKLYTGMELPEKDTLFPAGFGHIGGGYDAGYYSYLWALVYAQDAFSVFEQEGITNPKVGLRWRTEVLEKGSSMDEIELMKNFLGRKPSDKSFLKELGVK